MQRPILHFKLKKEREREKVDIRKFALTVRKEVSVQVSLIGARAVQSSKTDKKKLSQSIRFSV